MEISKTNNTDFLKVPKRHLTGAAKWRDIEDLINRWAKRNPAGARQQEMWLRATKETLYDKKNAKMETSFGGRYGRRSAETKYSTLIHPQLLEYLEAFYPDLFKTKESLHQFMTRFPKFKIRGQL